jgi:hypothetical protein
MRIDARPVGKRLSPRPFAAALLIAAAASAPAAQDGTVAGNWQNPSLGVVLDMTLDAHDAAGIAEGSGAFEGWSSHGLAVRALELDLSQNIDPFGSLHANVAVFHEGAELHEAYFTLNALPWNLALKGGQMLAAFGHFSRFHVHALPFASEPRLYREYLGGFPLLTGLEASWLAPIDHYVEITLSAYNRIEGHSHDLEPAERLAPSEADRIAEGLGYEKHGTHYHIPGGGTASAEEVEALGGESPEALDEDKGLGDFAYGGRLATTFEMGEDWSLDLGGSALYQAGHRHSRRIEGVTYAKGLLGLDANFFWHPLEANRYRSLDFGVEGLLNAQGFERRGGDRVIEDRFTRGGAFAHISWRHSARWQYGAFGEAFQPVRDDASEERRRYGAFLTFSPSHFQYLRLEASRYHFQAGEDPVHRVFLQYDAVIGYHSHGRLR